MTENPAGLTPWLSVSDPDARLTLPQRGEHDLPKSPDLFFLLVRFVVLVVLVMMYSWSMGISS